MTNHRARPCAYASSSVAPCACGLTVGSSTIRHEPVLSVTDHGVTVGDGVFEAVKVVDGRPFALTRHLRAHGAARRPAWACPTLPADDVRRGMAAVLDGLDLPLGKLRITYTGGAGAARLAAAATGRRPWWWPPTCSSRRRAEASAVSVPWPRNERGALAGLKTTSYAENVVALAYARERGGTEAVFANLAGHLCEGTGSNVFYVVGGELRTPSLASGCLAGITRALLLEWYGAREVDEPIEVLEDAEEILLVSTTRDVQARDQVRRAGAARRAR